MRQNNISARYSAFNVKREELPLFIKRAVEENFAGFNVTLPYKSSIIPFLDEISEELDGKMSLAKVNIDENPETPSKYGVRGIPTLMLFKGGEVASTKVGALPKSKLKEWVESVI